MNSIVKYFAFVFCIALWSTLCFVLPDFMDNPHEGWKGIGTLFVYVSAVGVCHFLLLSALSSSKILAVISYPLIALSGALVSFYRVTYHITITPLIWDVTLHTNYEEMLGVVSWQLLTWCALNLIISLAFVFYRWKCIRISYSWIYLCVSILCFVIYCNCFSRLRISLRQRYPLVITHSLLQYHQSHTTCATRTQPPFVVQSVTDSIDIVVVIGESVRSDHMQLNGYTRPTNPYLNGMQGVISFPHIRTQYSHTLVSVPDMLTRSDSLHPDRAQLETSFISILKQCGFQTMWISNQDLGGRFSYFPNECDSSIYVNVGKTDYVFHPWVDEDILPPLKQLVTREANKNLYILHTIGSHWYYNNHVPQQFHVFQPITNDRVVTNNDSMQVINSYDNTLVYLDYFLKQVITLFLHKCAIVIYVADHSESLGEHGCWLHASDQPEQKLPACILWCSPSFQTQFPEKVKALQNNHTKNYSMNFLFYSILNVAGIEAEGINPSVNIFSQE